MALSYIPFCLDFNHEFRWIMETFPLINPSNSSIIKLRND